MILVTGAKGVVGQPLVERLTADGDAFIAVSRQTSRSKQNVQWDLTLEPDATTLATLNSVATLIHCAPIWLLPKHLESLRAAGINRLIVFSSTSVISKQESSSESEQVLVTQLGNSERQLSEFCNANNMRLTILRPSMIYGHGRDQNISHIARFIRRFGFAVLAGNADGLRQPVHADDLVSASLSIVDKHNTFSKVYNLAGAEVLSYRNMVERVFAGLKLKPRIITIPLWLLRLALSLASKLTRFAYTPEMADRMSQNLNYDYSDASKDFDYQPQMFLQHPQQDLR